MVRAWDAYAQLSDLLKDDAWAILKELRYVRPTNSAERLKGVEREAVKKAIETARYVIPIAAFTSMVHTVSGLVLHRLHRMLSAGDTPYEARQVIGRMVDLVNQADPLFFEKVGLDTLGVRRAAGSTVPASHGRRRCVRHRVRSTAERSRLAAARLVGQRGNHRGRRRAIDVRPVGRRDDGRQTRSIG